MQKSLTSRVFVKNFYITCVRTYIFHVNKLIPLCIMVSLSLQYCWPLKASAFVLFGLNRKPKKHGHVVCKKKLTFWGILEFLFFLAAISKQISNSNIVSGVHFRYAIDFLQKVFKN